jgi:cobaltochelatase CobN
MDVVRRNLCHRAVHAELELWLGCSEHRYHRLDWGTTLFQAGQFRHHHGCTIVETEFGCDLCLDLIGSLRRPGAAIGKNIHITFFIDENVLSFSSMSSISSLSQIQPAITIKRPMLGQISICNGCCCGQTQKGHPEVPVEWLKQEWKYRGLLKRVHLSISGCLGPCDVPNVVLITSAEGTQWFAQISRRRQYEMLADWAEHSKMADRLLPLPREFDAHRLAAYRDDTSTVRGAR